MLYHPRHSQHRPWMELQAFAEPRVSATPANAVNPSLLLPRPYARQARPELLQDADITAWEQI